MGWFLYGRDLRHERVKNFFSEHQQIGNYFADLITGTVMQFAKPQINGPLRVSKLS